MYDEANEVMTVTELPCSACGRIYQASENLGRVEFMARKCPRCTEAGFRYEDDDYVPLNG